MLDDNGPITDPLMDTVHVDQAIATSTPLSNAADNNSSVMQSFPYERAMTPKTFALYQKLVQPTSGSGADSSSGTFAPKPPPGSPSSGRAITPRSHKLYQASMRDSKTSKLQERQHRSDK